MKRKRRYAYRCRATADSYNNATPIVQAREIVYAELENGKKVVTILQENGDILKFFSHAMTTLHKGKVSHYLNK